ncbi:HNH endonuclease signature motif containing protein [Modestobacter roseus]|nr:HNH endonuclease signature motif containing protein [Modestobacter roseus]
MTETAALPPPSVPLATVVDLLSLTPRPACAPAPGSPDDLLAARLQRLQRRRAQAAAEEAELILALAGQRPAAADPAPEHPGARRAGWTAQPGDGEVSEFCTAELAAVLNVGRGTAAIRLTRALTWVRKLPATFAALRAGELDERRAQQLADAVKDVPADVAARVEERLLGEARDLSVTRVGTRAAELVLQLDAAAAEEARVEAAKTADVHVYPSPADGRAVLAVDLPAEEAAAAKDLFDQLARMLKADGDERPIGLLRTLVASALILHPADNGLPLVTANLRITAALDALEGGNTPGEVNGLVITAAHLRDLLTRLAALGVTTPDGGSLAYAVTGPDGELLATLTPAELERLAKRGCPQHPAGDCGCAVAGPPPETTNYRPTERQRAFIGARDRRCRFPNCGQRVGWADLDHVVPHSQGGATACANLCCLCRSHHRLKTHAPGWRFAMTPDGTLQVTTPSGVTRSTRPPGLRPREPEPPPPPESPPDPTAGPPPPAESRSTDDDPPPF